MEKEKYERLCEESKVTFFNFKVLKSAQQEQNTLGFEDQKKSKLFTTLFKAKSCCIAWYQDSFIYLKSTYHYNGRNSNKDS